MARSIPDTNEQIPYAVFVSSKVIGMPDIFRFFGAHSKPAPR